MKLLAIDPSLSCTGCVLFEDNNVIKITTIKTKQPKKGQLDTRTISIASAFFDLLKVVNPDVIAIETQYISFNPGSALKVGEVRGVLQGVYFSYCFTNKKPPILIKVHPLEAKNAVGVSNDIKREESKKAVKDAVLNKFPQFKAGTDKVQDVFDAISIGLAGIFKYNLIKKVDKV